LEKSKLSELEWQIITTIWDMDKPVCVRDVLNKAYPKNEKAYTTVQTVMNNLFEKNILTREKIGLVNFYKPIEKKQVILKQEVQRFLNKTFSGSLNAMVSFIINSKEIDQKELEELKKLISERERSDI
jgi:BlaI family transcriptional regulator, penicillinase repressor